MRTETNTLARVLATTFPYLGQSGRCARCGAEHVSDGTAGTMLSAPTCAACQASTISARAATDARYREARAAAAAEARAARISRILDDVPVRYRGDAAPLTLASTDTAARVRRSAAIAEAGDAVGAPMITIVGHHGTGKSTLAAAIVGTIVERALAGDAQAARLASGAVWVSAPALARARARHKLGDGEAPIVAAALDASLLIVDDLGQEPADRDGAVGEVLYARHENGAPTIITTGCSSEDIAVRYGGGIARRLTERSSARVIRCAATGAGNAAA